MIDPDETYADIVGEMRRRKAGKAEDAWYGPEERDRLFDRLEAARKRELDVLHASLDNALLRQRKVAE